MNFLSRLFDAFLSTCELSWIRFVRDLHTYAGRPYYFSKITMITMDGEQQAKAILEYNEIMVQRLQEIGYDITYPDTAVQMFTVSCVAPEEFGFDDE